jgi:hypothetical protein
LKYHYCHYDCHTRSILNLTLCIYMPIQKKKKKKPKAKEKTPAVSQKVTQIVRVNVGDVKPKPRRRRAPAKKKDQPFAFGGGGGGGGLAQVVQAPQATQDVLQQSKELREIVNRLQTSTSSADTFRTRAWGSGGTTNCICRPASDERTVQTNHGTGHRLSRRTDELSW